MTNSKIVFMGTPSIAAGVLKTLIENGYNISLVVTQPDTYVGRKKVLTYSACKQVALDNNIEVFQPVKIRNDFQKVIDVKPDLILTCAYGQIIGNEVLNCAKKGCVNIHGSLLPKRRGGAPIQRSIIEGDKKTGITLMYMSLKMDEGDILFQEEIDIDIKDTSSSLFKKMEDLSCKMILKHLNDILTLNVNPIKQNHKEATYSSILTKQDELITFDRNVMDVYNHIRGMLDNPGCYFIFNNQKYKIKEIDYIIENVQQDSICLGIFDNKLKITCIGGSILISKIQPESKNVMDARSFFNGYKNLFLNQIIK